MKIILVKDIHRIGKAGAVVKVKNGFGRNYLLPKGFAIIASPGNLKKVEKIEANAFAIREKEILALKDTASKTQGLEFTFARKVDENNHLYGSVSEQDIIQALAEKDIDINKNNLTLEKHLKELGSQEIVVEFNSEIKATITITVQAEEE
ncbi:MAG: 50S ribosomal protein L9 [Candidatus Zophobacter franzmannii]|nr:50S ribosomal protein L9 [Candidatus Zophobacter franzmannii]